MPENTSFSDDAEQLNEQLSAYIDGELSPEETIVLEQRLAADEKLRKRLAGLKKNWGLLESLPRENVSSRFTASTVEMVAIRATLKPAMTRAYTRCRLRENPSCCMWKVKKGQRKCQTGRDKARPLDPPSSDNNAIF